MLGRIIFTLVLLVLATRPWGCASSADPTVKHRMDVGDRKMEWGLVYFRSWLREKDGKYLNLARQNTSDAIVRYFDIQFELGHSYPAFYIIDRRRREGCRFLREIDVAAARNRIELDSSEREGCLK